MVQKRKFNRIMALCIDNGEWCSDQNILKIEVVGFFEQLYGEILKPMKGLPYNIFPRLKPQDIFFGKVD